MNNDIELAIENYSLNRTDNNLRELDLALVKGNIIIPVSEDATEVGSKNYDIPVICLKTSAGDGAIPAFTAVDKLLKWKPEGCKYVTLTGKAVLEMALGMTEISEIVINVDGTPRGAIPRPEFERLITLG